MTDEQRLNSVAGSFNLVSSLVHLLEKARAGSLFWESNESRTPDGGYELHLKVYPPGVAPPQEPRP